MVVTNNRYFIINKPRNMVSQFVSSHRVKLLGDLEFDFPEGTHAVGRLDSHSEGLLILTTNKKVTRLLFESEVPHKRTYVVKVKKIVAPETLDKLREGVPIRVKGGGDYITAPCECDFAEQPDGFLEVENKITSPHTWIKLTLTEGKFHQVRKMVAAVNHQCIRLIRTSIENLFLDGLPAGGVREIDEDDFFEKLNIEKPANFIEPIF